MVKDARIRFTKKAIQDAFIKLLDEKPLNKITVKEICEIAEINRATFYKYYKDTYDWLYQLENIMLGNAQFIIDTIIPANTQEIITYFLERLRDKKEFLIILHTKYGDKFFYDRFFSLCILKINEKIKNESLFINDDHPLWKSYYLSYGCTGIIRGWIESGMNEEPSEVADYITKLINTK
jgi:AcrR family transcriptional regulator